MNRNWEAEFDRKFANATYSPDGSQCHCHDIKNFIIDLLTAESDRLVKEVEGKRKLTVLGRYPEEHATYNQALDDVISLIKGDAT